MKGGVIFEREPFGEYAPAFDARIKPCPFCGHNAYSTRDGTEEGAAFVVVCDGGQVDYTESSDGHTLLCDARGPWATTEEEAIEKWNHRA